MPGTTGKSQKIRKITNRNRIAPARRGSLPIVRIRLPNRSEIPVPACETVNPTDRRTAGLRRSIPQILYYICKTAVIVRLFTLKPSLFHEKTVYPFHRPVRDAAGRLQRRVRRFGARETTGRFRAAARTTRTALQRHEHQSRFDADYCHGTRPRRLHHLRRTADGKTEVW